VFGERKSFQFFGLGRSVGPQAQLKLGIASGSVPQIEAIAEAVLKFLELQMDGVGRAASSDSVIRWFKSIHPSQILCSTKPL